MLSNFSSNFNTERDEVMTKDWGPQPPITYPSDHLCSTNTQQHTQPKNSHEYRNASFVIHKYIAHSQQGTSTKTIYDTVAASIFGLSNIQNVPSADKERWFHLKTRCVLFHLVSKCSQPTFTFLSFHVTGHSLWSITWTRLGRLFDQFRCILSEWALSLMEHFNFGCVMVCHCWQEGETVSRMVSSTQSFFKNCILCIILVIIPYVRLCLADDYKHTWLLYKQSSTYLYWCCIGQES
jgi:hypothetical protein